MKRIKILHITVHLGGGAGKAISGIIIAGKKHIDSSVILLEIPKDRKYVKRLTDEGVKVFENCTIDDIKERLNDSDIVVFNWWGHPLMVRLFLTLPEVYCRSIIWNHINGCTYPFIQAEYLKEFDYCLFTSKYSYENTLWNDTDKELILEKSDIVYGMGEFEPSKIEKKTDYSIGSTFFVGYAGTIDYAKINENFLDYYVTLIEDDSNIKFIMLGNPSNEIINEIKERGLFELFEFPGYVSDVYGYLRKMDIYAYLLNPNCYATTENALIEAMAVGLPIVVLDNHVEKNIVINNINGYRVSDVNEFRNKITSLKNDMELRKTIGNSARKYCINAYSQDTNYKVYKNVCDKLMNKGKQKHKFRQNIGKTPFEAFCYFAGADASIIKELLSENIEKAEVIKRIPAIYKAKEKASIMQYARVFPDDRVLNYLVGVILNYENI